MVRLGTHPPFPTSQSRGRLLRWLNSFKEYKAISKGPASHPGNCVYAQDLILKPCKSMLHAAWRTGTLPSSCTEFDDQLTNCTDKQTHDLELKCACLEPTGQPNHWLHPWQEAPGIPANPRHGTDPPPPP